MLCEKGLLKNFAKFIGKYLCQSPFFNKVASLRPTTLLKKRLWHWCFPVSFVKLLRTPFFMEHLWWLLLLLVTNAPKQKYLSVLPSSIFQCKSKIPEIRLELKKNCPLWINVSFLPSFSGLYLLSEGILRYQRMFLVS